MKMAVHRVFSARNVISGVRGTVQAATVTDCLGFANVYPGILDQLAICRVRTLLLEPTVMSSAIVI